MAIVFRSGGESRLNYIYFCWGSAHSSVTAAAIHLRQIATDGIPSIAEVMRIPRFDLTPNSEVGSLFFMGDDGQGNNVYVLGLGSEHQAYCYLVDQYLAMLGLTSTDYRLVNCLPCVNWFTRIGGFSSRSLGLVWFGRRLAAYGVSRSFSTYVGLVKRVRASSEQSLGFLDWSPRV